MKKKSSLAALFLAFGSGDCIASQPDISAFRMKTYVQKSSMTEVSERQSTQQTAPSESPEVDLFLADLKKELGVFDSEDEVEQEPLSYYEIRQLYMGW
ncbi:MAG: hypothetical protein LBL99_02045 [Holosporaceae bacterium]|jgi:hypothetical protein|nr:hypothetical protein [Holosporaceae bacterium]